MRLVLVVQRVTVSVNRGQLLKSIRIACLLSIRSCLELGVSCERRLPTRRTCSGNGLLLVSICRGADR